MKLAALLLCLALFLPSAPPPPVCEIAWANGQQPQCGWIYASSPDGCCDPVFWGHVPQTCGSPVVFWQAEVVVFDANGNVVHEWANRGTTPPATGDTWSHPTDIPCGGSAVATITIVTTSTVHGGWEEVQCGEDWCS